MKLLIIFLIVAMIGSVVYFLARENAPVSPSIVTQKIDQTINPFEDMTVPYLRSRTYPSQLGELKEYKKEKSYTSYLTSYTSDGLHINALLTKPVGDPPTGGWPAIVFVHGYIAPTIYQTTQRYIDYVDYLARNGFVVMKIDLRGHGDSEGIPTGAYYSSGYVIDTLSARTALLQSDFVNKAKVGLWGHSMAGNIVMRSLAAEPDIPAVAIWAGAGYTYTDLQQYRIHDNSYRPPTQTASQSSRQRAIFDRFGQFSPDNTFWKTVAPTNYLSDIKGAIALFQAVDDPVVSIEYSRNLNSLLDKTSVPHELHEYPSGGHNLTGATFSKAMQATVAFYKKYL